MAHRGPEAKIQDAVIKYAREKHNALCVKNEAGVYHVGGFLDYTIYPDKSRRKTAQVFVVEFKAPGGELTPKQEYNVTQLKQRGHRAYKIDSVARGKLVIDQECG
jgi:hypothetical protein